MKKFTVILLLLTCCCLIPNPAVVSSQANAADSTPRARADGSKWRIAYCESESFITYSQTLTAIVKGLQETGWITVLPDFEDIASSNDSRLIWKWLAAHNISPYLEFVDDAFYNLRDPEINKAELIKRLNNPRDINLMLAMGGSAGVFLSNAELKGNIFVFAASNAVRSGIIASVQDSGKDNVWAHMDEQRFERQTRAFYDIIKFKKLGMVYEDSDNARIYSAVNEVEQLAEEKGFEIVSYHVQEPRTPEEFPRYYQEVQAAYNELAGQVDAVYVTISSLESNKLPELFEPFYEKKIPIFSQLGNIEVENGALFSISVMDTVNIGRFGADNIGKCLLGAKPRDLEQSFQSAPKIILNRKVAKKIEFKLPFELVIVLDEVY